MDALDALDIFPLYLYLFIFMMDYLFLSLSFLELSFYIRILTLIATDYGLWTAFLFPQLSQKLSNKTLQYLVLETQLYSQQLSS